jgi:hypothetical protein
MVKYKNSKLNKSKMKRSYISKCIVALLISSVIISCNKPDDVVLANEGTVYMPQSVGTRGKISLLLLDKIQPVTFGAAYGGLNFYGQDVTVNFKLDTAAVAAYNILNGTSYQVFPASSYNIPSFTGIISSGNPSSAPLQINFITTNLDPNTKYILPITIESASSGKIDSSLKTTFFSINKLANIYEGSYKTIGTRRNFNADGTFANENNIDDTRVLTTLSKDSCNINTIANLGTFNGTVFYVKILPDNTLKFTGFLSNNILVPVVNQPDKVSTYNPANKSFDVHYMYTNTNGTIRRMDEIWTRN